MVSAQGGLPSQSHCNSKFTQFIARSIFSIAGSFRQFVNGGFQTLDLKAFQSLKNYLD